MCSIFGSNDADEFFELAKLNSYRGTHSHSIAVINEHDSINIITKDFGPLERTELPKGYYIGHQQAPTTEASNKDSIHPSEGFGYLWHNGIIKAHQVKKWQDEFVTEEKWDTKLLQRLIEHRGYSALSDADGSFACVHYYVGALRLFRNDNCPMFVKGSSFSSTKFEGSESIESHMVYNYKMNKWNETDMTFKTKETFFWSP